MSKKYPAESFRKGKVRKTAADIYIHHRFPGFYFPEILRELKGDWELYESRMKRYQSIDILCIDDIGAEKVSEWSRDEVLGTILQTIMNHNLTTFFTSNLTLEELEKHFTLTDKSDERIKARRIMERIKQLTIDMELISENRRS